MLRPPPRSTRTDTIFPSPTLFRSGGIGSLVIATVDPVADPVLHPVLDSGVDSAHRPGVDGRGGLALRYLPYRRLCDLVGAVYILRRVSLALLHFSHLQLGALAGVGRLLRLCGGGPGYQSRSPAEAACASRAMGRGVAV